MRGDLAQQGAEAEVEVERVEPGELEIARQLELVRVRPASSHRGQRAVKLRALDGGSLRQRRPHEREQEHAAECDEICVEQDRAKAGTRKRRNPDTDADQEPELDRAGDDPRHAASTSSRRRTSRMSSKAPMACSFIAASISWP